MIRSWFLSWVSHLSMKLNDRARAIIEPMPAEIVSPIVAAYPS